MSMSARTEEIVEVMASKTMVIRHVRRSGRLMAHQS
jgi:hypothetical protein